MTPYKNNKYAATLTLALSRKTTVQDLFLLGTIDCYGDYGVTLGTLAKAVGVSAASITGRIDKLEKLKLVSRNHYSEDRRATYVKLLKPGKTLLNKLNTVLGL